MYRNKILGHKKETFTLRTSHQLMLNAYHNCTVIPAFNICYLPMLAPITKALSDMNTFGFLSVAKADWDYFGANSLTAVYEEYSKCCQERFMRLHVDHIPVIDENGNKIDYMGFIKEAIKLGYNSVMVDASRLSLRENIISVREVLFAAKPNNVAVEAELGAVMGHENKALPPYEELFRSKKGFTAIEEAAMFVKETGVDWLSVACGTIHGAVQSSEKDIRKIEARLDIDHLAKLKEATGIPLVLHGGSGISSEMIQSGIHNGISKINISTNLRQPYETALREGKTTSQAMDVVYCCVCELLKTVLRVENSVDIINPLATV